MVSAGVDVTCVIRRGQAGSAWCTGDGSGGKLGKPGVASSPIPIRVEEALGLGELSAVRVGSGHVCAIMPGNGTLWCWGANGKGQLFTDPATSGSWAQPVVVGVISNVSQVIAGKDFTCALAGNGSVSCVGDNSRGQLGIGTVPDSFPHYVPAPVSGLP
jgi:alpha-tubulin suppressor-like RCC1 family protein